MPTRTPTLMIALVLAVTAALCWWLSGVLLPLVLGAVLTLVLAPAVERWTPRLGSRARAITVALGAVVLVFLVLAAIAVPMMIAEARHWSVAVTGEGGAALAGVDHPLDYGDYADPDLTQWHGPQLATDAQGHGAPAAVVKLLREVPAPSHEHSLAETLGDRDGDGRLEPGYARRLRLLQRDKSSSVAQAISWLDKNGVLRGVRNAVQQALSREKIAKLLTGPQLSAASDVGMRVLGSVGDVLMALIGIAVAAILTPIYAFLLLLALPRWREHLPNYLPHDHRALWLRIGGRITESISAFVRGRVVVCGIVGAITAVGWALLGVRLGILAGLAIGALTLVPLANVLALVPVLLMSAIECATGAHGWGWLLGVLGVYAVGQIAESVLNPLIVGDAVQLDLLTMILALTVGGALAGFAGLVLAVPMAATLRILAEELWLPRWRKWATDPSAGSSQEPQS
jgi:predicted PurR-regulated permease PerM